jgi:superfamily II helicase
LAAVANARHRPALQFVARALVARALESVCFQQQQLQQQQQQLQQQQQQQLDLVKELHRCHRKVGCECVVLEWTLKKINVRSSAAGCCGGSESVRGVYTVSS